MYRYLLAFAQRKLHVGLQFTYNANNVLVIQCSYNSNNLLVTTCGTGALSACAQTSQIVCMSNLFIVYSNDKLLFYLP